MLTALFAAAALVAGSTADGAPRPSAIFAFEDSPSGFQLVRLAPSTLAETGHADPTDLYPGSYAYSPDRTGLAVAGFGHISFIDSRSVRETGRLPVNPGGGRTLWPRPRVVLAMGLRVLVRIDPSLPRVVQTWPIEPLWFSTFAGDHIVGIVRPPYEDSPIILGDPIRFRFLSSSGPQGLVRLERMRLAFEDWRVSPGAILPPLASEGVALAQADLSERKSIPPGEIAAVSVVPYEVLNGIAGPGGYQIVLSARSEYFSYVARVDGAGGISAQFLSQLPGAPGPSDHDILHAPIGTWEVSGLLWAVDQTRQRAYAITGESVFADVDLRKGQVRLRPLARKVGALGWQPAFLGSGTIALPTSPVTLLDVRSARLRRLRIDGPRFGQQPQFEIARAGRRFIIYRLTSGMKLIDMRGRVVHRFLTWKYVDSVQVGGRYAYATFFDDGQTMIGVIDLRQERMVRTVRPAHKLYLLPAWSGF